LLEWVAVWTAIDQVSGYRKALYPTTALFNSYDWTFQVGLFKKTKESDKYKSVNKNTTNVEQQMLG